jgi:transaldolase
MTINGRTAALHALGQSLWLDNITRALLDSGTLQRYIDELSVTGLTSNPTIYDHALKGSTDYDDDIRRRLKQGESGEALFFGLALQDLTRAADLFRPVHRRTRGVERRLDAGLSPDVGSVASLLTRRRPTRFASRRWPPRSPSTRCRRAR